MCIGCASCSGPAASASRSRNAVLSLYGDKERESADVKAIAEIKLAEIDRKIAELASLRDVLSHLVHNCNGDERRDCAIIDGLAGSGTVQ